MAYKLAIDGPAGSGKSTIAKILAENNNLTFFSTGFLFRAFALILIENNFLNQSEIEIVELLKKNKISYQNGRLLVNDVCVDQNIKTEKISSLASSLATKKNIRNLYNEIVQKMIMELDVVLEGRDIGTIIIPNANLKIYLTASIIERAKRRKKEFDDLKIKSNFLKIWFNIFWRDFKDKHRKIAPLKKAKDAIVIRTNNKSINTVVNEIQQYIKK